MAGYINKTMLTAVVADQDGRIFELEGFAAAGISSDMLFVLKKSDSVPMPHGSELMMLPDRRPVVYNPMKKQFEVFETHPFDPDQKIFPVAVFNSPGYVNRHFCAYDEGTSKGLLPLFSYGAVGYGSTGFRSAALQVDAEPRQDLRQMPQKGIIKGVNRFQKKYPDNRLIRHLETCALQYGCPAGKNFFLSRYEAPLPTSTVCNANCLGCISLQKENNLCACQDRIAFTPTPEEIIQVSLEHISHVKKAVVSFGQGCEGEPLTAFNSIEPAIRGIREKTDQGTINLNTNASLPDHVEKLCRAGLDAMRVSLNSVREPFYNTYFRPKSYCFEDVVQSIKNARSHNCFVALNYLNCPGFTDTEQEFNALVKFIKTLDINMIQWRNLNFDPKAYCRKMSQIDDDNTILGMSEIIKKLSGLFPNLIHGYFNPPKENYGRR